MNSRYKTERLGSTPAIPPVPRAPGWLRGRVWGPRRENFAYSKPSIWVKLYVNNWPPDCNVFVLFSRVPIWSLTAWSATSQLPIGIFLGIKILMSRQILDEIWTPTSYFKCTILELARFARFARLTDVNGCAPGPTYHAPDTRMT